MYDIIAGSMNPLPESHFISKAETMFQFPLLRSEGLRGGLVIYDGQQNDTRMNLYIALTAAQSGASMLNHTKVLKLNTVGKLGDEDYKVVGARVQDMFTGAQWDIKAKQVRGGAGRWVCWDRSRWIGPGAQRAAHACFALQLPCMLGDFPPCSPAQPPTPSPACLLST